jgi:hypothetical protein
MPLISRRAHVGVWATDTRLETESLEDDKMLEDGRLGLLDGRVLDIVLGRSRCGRRIWSHRLARRRHEPHPPATISEGHVRPRISLRVVYPVRSYACRHRFAEGDMVAYVEKNSHSKTVSKAKLCLYDEIPVR